jgi:hypothetical protein
MRLSRYGVRWESAEFLVIDLKNAGRGMYVESLGSM